MMQDSMVILYAFLLLVNLFWLGAVIQSKRAKRELPYLLENGEPNSSPKVSILVPARNEAKILSHTLQSLLSLDYPDFEVIVIDDQSEDATPEIAASAAAQDSRVIVLRSEDLPEGWRGKTWALQHGLGLARGTWLLLTDADMVFEPGVLKAAVAQAQNEKLDLLSILPHVECKSFWERVMLPSFIIILATARPLHKVNDPDSQVALAAGGFILVKSLVLKSLGGYSSIRNTIIEDVRLSELFKLSGYRIKCVISKSFMVRTRMYDSLAGIWEGLSRHAFEGSGHSPVRLFGALLGGFLMVVLPFALLIAALILHNWTLLALTVIPVISMAWAQDFVNRQTKVPRTFLFSFPLATLVYAFIMMNSMWRHHHGGTSWKGRRYPKTGQATQPGR
jgi:hopene-associated glycosyltransferase HpnB